MPSNLLKAGSHTDRNGTASLHVILDGKIQLVQYKPFNPRARSSRTKHTDAEVHLYRIWLSQLLCDDFCAWPLNILPTEAPDVCAHIDTMLHGDRARLVNRLRAQLRRVREDTLP